MKTDNAHNTPREKFALTINADLCGECVFCISVCPFEALAINPETKKVVLDQDKCRLCGICSATCPSGLIGIEYYDTASLSEYVKRKMGEIEAKKLTIACRGTGLTPKGFQEKIPQDGKDDSIFLTLPCVGRINMNFLLDAVEAGIQKITIIACEEDSCRYREGSKIMHNKFDATQLMLEDIGYSADMIDFQTMALRANIDEKGCIACGTCAFLCPYDAIRIEQSAILDKERCMGCGICVASCPAIAITLEGSDFDMIGAEIEAFAKEPVEPRILVLGCQWSEYRYLDENVPVKKGVRFIPMPCSGRIDILHILRALSMGIDGILISMCLDDICNLENGNKRTQARISKLNHQLEKLKLNERVKICSVHPKYIDMFNNELTIFIQEIGELGLSPLRRRI